MLNHHDLIDEQMHLYDKHLDQFVPVASSNLLITFIHFSIAERITKSVSLITVIVHVSNVLSPATFKIRPLNGISTGAMVDAGSAAAFTRNLDFPVKHHCQLQLIWEC